jgi:hypothetical protein
VTLIEIAQVYVDLVQLEKEIPEREFQAKDRANALRTKYHELLMAKMREAGIPFLDRFDAANKAFGLVQQEHLHLPKARSLTDVES